MSFGRAHGSELLGIDGRADALGSLGYLGSGDGSAGVDHGSVRHMGAMRLRRNREHRGSLMNGAPNDSRTNPAIS